MTSLGEQQSNVDDQADDGLILDREGREVWLDGHLIDLTRTEFDVVAMLMDHPRQVLSSGQLLEGLWHSAHVSDSGAIETYVSRIRKKLGESSRSPRFLHTVRGVGYKYVPQSHAQVERRTAIYDNTGILVAVEPDSEPLLGWALDEIIGTRFIPTAHPLVRNPVVVGLINRMAEHAGLQWFSLSQEVLDQSGERRQVDVTCSFLFDDDRPSHLRAEFVIRD